MKKETLTPTLSLKGREKIERGALYFLTATVLIISLFPPLPGGERVGVRGDLFASEVIEETRTQVIVREHPKTGKSYVSIVSADNPDPKDPFTGQRQKFSRPDYRLLDPQIKAKDIPYEGPYSDRKKVFLFAASIAAVGAAGGIAGLAATPAAAGAGASGPAGAYMAGAGAVAGTAAAASVHATTGSGKDNFIHRSESQEKVKKD